MIESISNMLLQYLIEAGVVDDNAEDKAYYKYGLEISISSFFNIILIILIGVIFNKLGESIVFLVCFIPLRQFTGGYHANSYFKCNLLFSILFIILLLIYSFTVTYLTFYGSALIVVFSITVFLSECPIEHPNKLLSVRQKMINKYLSVILGLLYGIVGVIFKVLLYNIGVIILYTLLLISFLVIVATFQNIGKEGN